MRHVLMEIGAYAGLAAFFGLVVLALLTFTQARDLRRTAMLRMAEAGATVPQIASVSGHSIEATQPSAVTGAPSLQASPSRSAKVQASLSGLTSQRSSICGLKLPALSIATSVS